MTVIFLVTTSTGTELATFDSEVLGGSETPVEEMKKAAQKIYKKIHPNSTIISVKSLSDIKTE